jgi:hypothetical protein
MKKLLALVLALVMTLGLATVGTNAATWSDLKDTDKVAADREEAFKVLNSIQIFESDENNNLNPDAQLTRAEAAKIIATLNLGKTAADNLSGNGGKFSDVPASNWASGYIEYCASTGIIAGRGDGTFDPAGSLTFAAFSKMLLVSLGYVAEVEELVGGEWEFNVARIATTIDLYKGMDTPASKEIVKRADAAQMAFNVLKTPMVTYAYNGTNLLTNISAVGKTAAVYETTAARDTQTISTATVNDGSARGTYMVEFAERHFPKLTRNSHDTDDWGRPCTTWTLNREVVGSFVNSDIVVFTTNEDVKGSELYKVLGGATLLSQYANDLTGAFAFWNIYVDGVELTANTNPTKAAVITRIRNQGSWMGDGLNTIANRIAGAGTELTVYLDEDSYYNYGVVTNDTAKVPVVTIVVRNTWLAEALADYNTTDKNLLLGVYTADDAPETKKAATSKVAADLTGYKEGDWVLVKMTRDDNVVREVSDPEIVKGAYINAYTVVDGMDTITVDSKDEYGIAATAHTDATILRNYTLRELQGFTYDLYTDGQASHLYGIQYASKDTDLVFVAGYEKDSTALAATTLKANLIFMDGTMATKTVSLAPQGNARAFFNAAGKSNQVLNTWFEYAKATDGTIVLRNRLAFAGEVTGAGPAQYSVVLDPTYDVNPDIDSKHTTMAFTDKAGANLFAVGSDNTIYISAVADDSVKTGTAPAVLTGAISRVTGVTKGVKNASMIGVDTDKYEALDKTIVKLNAFNATTTVGGAAKSNAYFVYDANRYIVAAVVLTENTAADHLMYIIDDGNPNGINKRENVAGVGYVDHYTAILDGKTELVDVKVDSLKTNTDTNKLAVNTLYAVAYDSTGEYVVYATEATNTPAQLTGTLNQQRGWAEYVNALTNKTTIQVGDQANRRTTNMLYVKNTLGDNVGYIALNASGNYWVYRPDTDTYTRYGTASAAYAAATTADSKGNGYSVDSVYAMCDKATGSASTMVFIAKLSTAGGVFVAAGNTVTALGTANGTTYKASTASIGNIIVNKTTGTASADVKYTAPLYVARNAAATFTVRAYTQAGALVDAVPVAGTLKDGVLNTRVTFPAGTFTTGETYKFEIDTESFSAVKVRYLDKDGKELTVAASATDTTGDLIYGSATTLVKDGVGVLFADFKADLNKGKYAAQTPAYTITGIVGTDNDKTATANSGVGITGTSTLKALAKTGGTSTMLEAKGDDYVDVKFGAALDPRATRTITVDAGATGKALSTFGVTTATDSALTLTVAATGTTTLSKGANYALSNIKVSLSGDTTNDYGYIVKIGSYGTALIDGSAGATAVSLDTTDVITMDDDVVITADDITVTPMAKIKIVAGSWTANSITLVYNEKVDKTTAEAAAYTWVKAAGTQTGTPVKVGAELQADGKTVVITYKDEILMKGNTIALTATTVEQAGTAGADATYDTWASGNVNAALAATALDTKDGKNIITGLDFAE